MEHLSPSMAAPLVGLGTAAAAFLGWVLVHRLLPPPFNGMTRLWFLASLALGLLGYWMVPCEGRYPAPEVKAWQARQPALTAQPEWQDFRAVWRALGEVSPGPEAGPALTRLGRGLIAAVEGLRAVQDRGLLSEADVRALGAMAVQRHTYLRSWASRPAGTTPDGWESGMSAVEARLRFLSLVKPVPESDHLLWQQRVRLAREIAMLEQIAADRAGSEELLKAGGPDFGRVAVHHRALSLLLVDLSVSADPASAPAPISGPPACGPAGQSCGTQQRAACQEAGPGSCGMEQPAARGCCGE